MNPLDALAGMVSATAEAAEAAAARLSENCERMRKEIAFRSIPASTIRRAISREQILRHRRGLLDLFRDPPTWPPARGRSGLLPDSGRVFLAVGQVVELRGGGGPVLRAVVYDTRTGMVRCRVQQKDGSLATFDPEEITTPGQASFKAS